MFEKIFLGQEPCRVPNETRKAYCEYNDLGIYYGILSRPI